MTEPSNVFRARDAAIMNTILDHILSGRERLGLPAPTPVTGFSVAAGDAATWFAAEEDFEDKIHDYLGQRCVHHIGTAFSSWACRLKYGIDVWPIDTEPSAIARDMIERIDLSEILNAPELDYLGIGSSFGIMDDSGATVQVSGGQPRGFGYALVIAYATDGTGTIVDRINRQRGMVGATPLQISAPLCEMARKYIELPTADEAGRSLSQDVQDCGYLIEGWRVRLHYNGVYANLSADGDPHILVEETAYALATELLKGMGSTLLRADWQDIGIATAIRNYRELGGLAANAEFVIGWRIPFDAERPAHFPPPIRVEDSPSSLPDAIAQPGNEIEYDALLGPSHQEPPPKPRRRTWWPFRPRA